MKSIIELDRGSAVPLYNQISRSIERSIRNGMLKSGSKLLGSRKLSDVLGVHRQTVVAALEDLERQGWIHTVPAKGVYVQKLFIPNETTQGMETNVVEFANKTGYTVKNSAILSYDTAAFDAEVSITDGVPDARIAPINEIGKAYSRIIKLKVSRKNLGYGDVEGNQYYRTNLAEYLNQTRGLPIVSGNILTTRGVQMGIYLVTEVLVAPGDAVVVGSLSYSVANMIFQNRKATLLTIPVDEFGLDTSELRKLCQKRKIRMVYVTTHHHYPTTVTMSVARRVELLQLASEFGFVILEDDHDYDYHYQNSLLLPLASTDTNGMVVYVGSFCKALMPGLRQGYIVAPQNLIKELAKLRHVIDRQGDLVMEQVIGEFLKEGGIQKHLKKAIKTYELRRNTFAKLLNETFGEKVQFTLPPGGLAIWTEWKVPISLLKMAQLSQKKGLALPLELLYQTKDFRAIRLGFGDLNEEEMERAIQILKESTDQLLASKA